MLKDRHQVHSAVSRSGLRKTKMLGSLSMEYELFVELNLSGVGLKAWCCELRDLRWSLELLLEVLVAEIREV